MDDIVRQSLAKWPNVPHCTGWLLLDRRGEWRLRDDAAQAAGELGSPIRHAALNAFIGRNYECDAHGQWFFQNGPQRVYVELAYTPWVVRLAERDGQLTLADQTGTPFEPDAAWLDDANLLADAVADTSGTTFVNDHVFTLLVAEGVHDAVGSTLHATAEGVVAAVVVVVAHLRIGVIVKNGVSLEDFDV